VVKYISDSWKTKIATDYDHEIRAYLNPRGIEYGPISSAGSFVAVSSSDNAPGTFNGYQLNNTYAIQLSTPLTIDMLVKPNFAYNVAEYIIASWVYGTNYVKIGYNHTNARFFITTYTSSETRVYFGPTFVSDATLKVYQRLSFVLSGTTVDAYHNASVTSSAFVTTGLTNLNILNVGGGANCYINNIRIFNIATTQAQINNHFKEVANKEIYFDFNKKHCGRERCSVTATRDMFSYTIENQSTYTAATASISLFNANGQFNDDLFKPLVALFPAEDLYPSATLYPMGGDYSFQPELGYYNGTSSQIYLRRRVGLEIEAWNTYTDIDCFEPLFIGSIPTGSFSRSVQANGISSVSVSATDGIYNLAMRVVRKNRYWEDYYLTSETTPASSLFHVIAKLATEREVYNYICNSGFENTTIANSWNVLGGTIARSNTQAMLGTYSCKANCTSLYQDITFELSKGEKFNFSTFIYSTSPVLMSVKLGEYINATTVATSQEAIYHGGNGWQLINVNHTIINSTSNKLRCTIEPGVTTDIYIDGCMLVYGDYKPYYIDNTSDGTSGASLSSQGVRGAYDWIGIDSDTVTYQHPWAVVKEGKKIWDYLKQIGDACIARYLYIDRSGVLVFKSNFTTTIGSSIGTIGKASGISSGTQSLIANKVKVAGVYINKQENVSCVWEANASGVTDENTSGSVFYRTIDSGETFPTATESPDGLECKYGDVYEGDI